MIIRPIDTLTTATYFGWAELRLQIQGIFYESNYETYMISSKTETKLLDALNEVIAMEYGAVIQYAQHSFSVSGQDRMQYAPFFDANSKEAHLHALNLGNKIVALGGVPITQPAPVQQASTLGEMLMQDLQMERSALAAYVKVWELAENNQMLRFWVEDIIRLEQLHVEELERMTANQERQESLRTQTNP